jgi:hypothetical protein
VAALAASLASSAAARAADAEAECPAQPLAQVFKPWHDPGWYALTPNGGFEDGRGGWSLDGAASLIAENEPFHVRAQSDRNALALAPGASATSPSFCVGAAHPTMRFFARNAGALDSKLNVSVLIRDAVGQSRSVLVGAITATSGWAPTPPLAVTANLLAGLGTRDVALRFTPMDGGGNWAIDDVYVDPYAKG